MAGSRDREVAWRCSGRGCSRGRVAQCGTAWLGKARRRADDRLSLAGRPRGERREARRTSHQVVVRAALRETRPHCERPAPHCERPAGAAHTSHSYRGRPARAPLTVCSVWHAPPLPGRWHAMVQLAAAVAESLGDRPAPLAVRALSEEFQIAAVVAASLGDQPASAAVPARSEEAQVAAAVAASLGHQPTPAAMPAHSEEAQVAAAVARSLAGRCRWWCVVVARGCWVVAPAHSAPVPASPLGPRPWRRREARRVITRSDKRPLVLTEGR